MENNIVQFDADQRAQEEALAADMTAEMEAMSELTPEEQKEIEKAKKEVESSAILVRETIGSTNKTVELDEYLESVDKSIPTLKSDGTKLMSMTPPDELSRYVNSVKGNAENELREFAQIDLTDAELVEIEHETIAAVKKILNTDKLTREMVLRGLSRVPMTELINQLPRRTIQAFVPANKMKSDRGMVKDILINVIDFMVINGPECDDFSSYLENQTKVINVMQALNEVNFQVRDMLQSKDTLSEIAKETLKDADPRTMSYMKYVKSPDAINLIFSQYAKVSQRFADAYREIRGNYTDPDEIAVVDHEIEEAEAKTELYHRVLKLETFTTVMDIFHDEFMNDRRRSKSSLEKVAKTNLDRIRRIKIDAPFPGYTGAEKTANELYVKYIQYIEKHGALYNTFVEKANQTESEKLCLIEDFRAFANLLLIIMGRLEKRLMKEPCTYRDKYEVVITFEMFCRLCTDIFTTAKVVELTQPFIREINTLNK